MPPNTYTLPGGGTVNGWTESQALNLLQNNPTAVDPVTQLTPAQTLLAAYGYSGDQLSQLEEFYGYGSTTPVAVTAQGPSSPITAQNQFVNPYLVDASTGTGNGILNEQGPSTNYVASGVSLDTAGSADYFTNIFGEPVAGFPSA